MFLVHHIMKQVNSSICMHEEREMLAKFAVTLWPNVFHLSSIIMSGCLLKSLNLNRYGSKLFTGKKRFRSYGICWKYNGIFLNSFISNPFKDYINHFPWNLYHKCVMNETVKISSFSWDCLIGNHQQNKKCDIQCMSCLQWRLTQ